MTPLIALACVLTAVAAAPGGYNVKVHHPHGYSTFFTGSQHVQNGYPTQVATGAPVPLGDAPDVTAAKSAHLQAHAAATARHYAAAAAAPPDHHHYSHENYDARPVAYNGYTHSGALFHAEPRIVDPVAIAAGASLPVGDTAEVAHAKALHFKAHAARANLIRYRRGVHAVAYNAPLVHDVHPIVQKALYNAPLFTAAHSSGHHATSHTSVTIGNHAYQY